MATLIGHNAQSVSYQANLLISLPVSNVVDVDIFNPLQPKRTLRSSLEYALFYQFCALYRALEVLDTFNWWTILSLKCCCNDFLLFQKDLWILLNILWHFLMIFRMLKFRISLTERCNSSVFLKLNQLLNKSGSKGLSPTMIQSKYWVFHFI